MASSGKGQSQGTCHHVSCDRWVICSWGKGSTATHSHSTPPGPAADRCSHWWWPAAPHCCGPAWLSPGPSQSYSQLTRSLLASLGSGRRQKTNWDTQYPLTGPLVCQDPLEVCVRWDQLQITTEEPGSVFGACSWSVQHWGPGYRDRHCSSQALGGVWGGDLRIGMVDTTCTSRVGTTTQSGNDSWRCNLYF